MGHRWLDFNFDLFSQEMVVQEKHAEYSWIYETHGFPVMFSFSESMRIKHIHDWLDKKN